MLRNNFVYLRSLLTVKIMDAVDLQYLPIKLGELDAFIFMMKVKDLEFIHYVARRGCDNEESVVQRVLSPVRLKTIEKYVSQGNIFYTPFFLNWTNFILKTGRFTLQ